MRRCTTERGERPVRGQIGEGPRGGQCQEAMPPARAHRWRRVGRPAGPATRPARRSPRIARHHRHQYEPCQGVGVERPRAGRAHGRCAAPRRARVGSQPAGTRARAAPTLWPMVDRLERLTDLVMVLFRDQRPKSLREIASEVPGYPAHEGEARRQAFERDKRTLRDGGIEVPAVAIDGPEQIGYVIRPEDYYLPDLDLTSDEQAALNLAVAGVHFGDPSGQMRCGAWDCRPRPGRARWRSCRRYRRCRRCTPPLHARATVGFGYRGERRQVDPALLHFDGGWWYLVGYDLDRDAPRTFRVDRMEPEVSAGEPGSAQLPDGFDPHAALPDVPWRIGGGAQVTVEVQVDATMAALVVDEVGEQAVLRRIDDGSVVLGMEVTNADALRTWLLEFGDRAEVLAPTACTRTWWRGSGRGRAGGPGGS